MVCISSLNSTTRTIKIISLIEKLNSLELFIVLCLRKILRMKRFRIWFNGTDSPHKWSYDIWLAYCPFCYLNVFAHKAMSITLVFRSSYMKDISQSFCPYVILFSYIGNGNHSCTCVSQWSKPYNLILTSSNFAFLSIICQILDFLT